MLVESELTMAMSSQSLPAPATSLKSVFPFAPGTPVEIRCTLSEPLWHLLQRARPELALLLQSFKSLAATVRECDDDNFVIAIPAELAIPSWGASPATTVANPTLRMRRYAGTTYRLEATAAAGDREPSKTWGIATLVWRPQHRVSS